MGRIKRNELGWGNRGTTHVARKQRKRVERAHRETHHERANKGVTKDDRLTKHLRGEPRKPRKAKYVDLKTAPSVARRKAAAARSVARQEAKA